MGKALSKCCPVGRRRKPAAPEEGDTPQIVPVDDVSEDQKETPTELQEKEAEKPGADTSNKEQEGNKPDNEPAVVQEQTSTEQTPAAAEEKPPTEQDAEEEATVRTIVTEKVIEDPKSTPVIIDTTKSVETKTVTEGEDVSTSEVTTSESVTTHSTQVVKTVITETVIREGGDGAEESTVTKTETVTVVEEGDTNKTETAES